MKSKRSKILLLCNQNSIFGIKGSRKAFLFWSAVKRCGGPFFKSVYYEKPTDKQNPWAFAFAKGFIFCKRREGDYLPAIFL